MGPIETSSPLRILLVEDDKHDRLIFRRALQNSEVTCEITEYERAEEALERIRADASAFDLVVIDHALPGMSGAALCKELLHEKVPFPLVILTGRGSEELAIEALKAGVDDYIIKDSGKGYLDLLSVVLPEVVRKHGDLRARKEAEEALRESEEKYSTLVENSLTGIFIHQDGRYVFVNDRFAGIHGYQPGELLGQDPLTLIHPDEREALRQVLSRRLEGESVPERYEVRRLKKDGKVIWCEMMASRIEYAGRPAIMGNIIDITDRKRVEEALQHSEANYRLLFSAESDAIIVLDTETKEIVDANEAALALYGYAQKELLGLRAIDLWAEPKQSAQFLEQVASEEPFVVSSAPTQSFHKKKDSTIFPVEISSGVYVLGGRKLVCTVIRDITERKRAEEALQESEKRYRAVLECSPDPFVVYDMEGKCSYINSAFTTVFGWTPEECIGKRLDYIPMQNWPETRLMIDTVMAGQSFSSVESRRYTKDGNILDVSISAAIYLSHDGIPVGSVHFLRDITKQKRAEEALQQRKEELKAQAHNLYEVNTALKVLLKQRDEDKHELEDKVVSNVKELILPYVQILRNTPLDSKQMGYVSIIESNLNTIVSPFLKKLSSQYLALTPKEIQVAGLVKEGKTSKEIAEMLHVSPRAVEFHRENIRTKLGLKNKKVNLRSHLLSLM